MFFLDEGEGEDEITPLSEIIAYYDKSDLFQPLFRKIKYKLRDDGTSAVKLIDNKRVGLGMRFGKFIPFRAHTDEKKARDVSFYSIDFSMSTHEFFRAEASYGVIDNENLSYTFSDDMQNLYNAKGKLKSYYIQAGGNLNYPLLHLFEVSIGSGLNYLHTDINKTLSRYIGSQIEEFGTSIIKEDRFTIYGSLALGISPNSLPIKFTIGVKTNDLFQLFRHYDSGSEWSAGFQFLF